MDRYSIKSKKRYPDKENTQHKKEVPYVVNFLCKIIVKIFITWSFDQLEIVIKSGQEHDGLLSYGIKL